jgi:hypothetical protein
LYQNVRTRMYKEMSHQIRKVGTVQQLANAGADALPPKGTHRRKSCLPTTLNHVLKQQYKYL